MARKMKLIKGRTLDERLQSVDKLLSWMSKRLNKKVLGVIPPIPFDTFVEEVPGDGVLFKKFFVLSGTISRGLLYVEEMPSNSQAVLTVSIAGPDGGAHVDVPMKKTMQVAPNMQVLPGQRLTVSVNPPDGIRGVWVGLLLEPVIAQIQKEQFLLEQLVPMLEEEEAEIAREGGEGIEEEGQEEVSPQ